MPETTRQTSPLLIGIMARMKSSRRNVVFSQIDHQQAGYLSADLILQRGHENIGVVAGPANRYSTQACNSGFESALRSRGPENAHSFLLNAPTFKPEDGADAMQRMLALVSRPTAVFFHHEHLAAGALSVCETQHIRVPEDISVMACSLRPPLMPDTFWARVKLTPEPMRHRRCGQHRLPSRNTPLWICTLVSPHRRLIRAAICQRGSVADRLKPENLTWLPCAPELP